MFEHLQQLADVSQAETRAMVNKQLWKRRWSFGDVENNGFWYHPQLTHYAHQAFGDFFLNRAGLLYVDLSRSTAESATARAQHDPPILRMAFPVEWLHQ